MLFSSISFLYYFLPCVLIVYFAVPKALKNGVLVLASLLFYAWGEPKYLILMLLAAAQGYGFGLLLEKERGRKRAGMFLAASVLFSFGLLGYFKYSGFLVTNLNGLTGLSLPVPQIALPLGISFYTFQVVSYVIDVYRGDVPAQRNIVDFAAYLTMFPQLIAGPIVRYRDIAPQLRGRAHRLETAASGVRRFLLGLGKKVLLANQLGLLVSKFKAAPVTGVVDWWVYAAAFTLQIYFDFSGYSDMAIGLGRLFGFSFPENFNYPYLSGSITEFWRRWHISLGSWFRDYLYIPLGGSRKGPLRRTVNILIVWLATGLWHGAAWNFALWGLLFALLLLAEKQTLLPVLDRHRALGHVYVLFFVTLGFVLFDAGSLSEAGKAMQSLFGLAGLPLTTAEGLYRLRSFAAVLPIAAVGATPLPALAVKKLSASVTGSRIVAVAEPLLLTALLALCTAFLVDGSFNPFLYFRF